MANPKEAKEVADLKSDIFDRAERIIVKEFPDKIHQLGIALEGDLFDIKTLSLIVEGTDIPAFSALENKQNSVSDQTEEAETIDSNVPINVVKIPSNSRLLEVVNFLKPEIVQLADRCSNIKEWIQLMVPKIEDGNNFGVSVQGSILSEVSKAEGDALSYLQQLSGYFNTRAQLLTKLVKHPQLQDYHRAVEEYDQRVFVNFRLILKELRSIYAVLYDVILKNYEKLKNPRTSHDSSMY